MSVAIFPGAGSAGIAWEPTARRIDATIVVAPAGDDVVEMAAVLGDGIEAMPRPRILVGSSMGALIAIEIARQVSIDGLVLVAAGFGIPVAQATLDWIASEPPGLVEKMAASVLADGEDSPHLATVVADFETRGPDVMLQHMTALARHDPSELSKPPPTMVLYGMRDRAVRLEGAVELAQRLRGYFVPIRTGGHVPYLDAQTETVRWISDAIWRFATSPRLGRRGPSGRQRSDRPH